MRQNIFIQSIFILSLLCSTAKAQINQLDANGKKHGRWIIFLTKDWKRTDDSSKAVYKRYSVFDHGTNLYPMGACGGKGYKLEGKTGGMLDGTYKWFDARGRLTSEHVLKNGDYVSCKEYYPTGEVEQHFDYSKKCEEQKEGWCVTIYQKNGTLRSQSFMCPDKNGKWPVTRD